MITKEEIEKLWREVSFECYRMKISAYVHTPFRIEEVEIYPDVKVPKKRSVLIPVLSYINVNLITDDEYTLNTFKQIRKELSNISNEVTEKGKKYLEACLHILDRILKVYGSKDADIYAVITALAYGQYFNDVIDLLKEHVPTKTAKRLDELSEEFFNTLKRLCALSYKKMKESKTRSKGIYKLIIDI